MQGWRICTIRGIAVEINYTWLVMFGLFMISFSYLLRPLRPEEPAWSWVAGAAASLIFVCSVLLHELCHSLVALSLGLPVKRITLFIFGGVAQIEGEVQSPRAEFLMAAAGPASSFALAAGFWLLGGQNLEPGRAGSLLGGVLSLSALINLRLGEFNMLPGLPLDGGRVLHSILWGVTGDEYRSTRITAFFGQVLGAAFMVGGGVLAWLLNSVGSGMWIFFIGWLILSVAGAEGRQAMVKRVLRGLQVGQVMHWPLVTLPVNMNLAYAVQEYAATRAQPFYPVVDEQGRVVGVLDRGGLQQVEPARWSQVAVGQVMAPVDAQAMTIGVSAPATEALLRMRQNERGWLLVTSPESQPLGLVTESAILAAAEHRSGPAAA